MSVSRTGVSFDAIAAISEAAASAAAPMPTIAGMFSCPHADDRRDVFLSRTQVPLLNPAGDDRSDRCALAENQRRRAGRTSEVLSRKAERIDIQLLYVDGDHPRRAPRIGVHRHICASAYCGELIDRLDCSDFGACMDDGDESRSTREDLLEIVR